MENWGRLEVKRKIANVDVIVRTGSPPCAQPLAESEKLKIVAKLKLAQTSKKKIVTISPKIFKLKRIKQKREIFICAFFICFKGLRLRFS